MLHGLRSTRETGACTKSAGHRKEAWQCVAVQRNRDLGLSGCCGQSDLPSPAWPAQKDSGPHEPLKVLLIFSFLFVPPGA